MDANLLELLEAGRRDTPYYFKASIEHMADTMKGLQIQLAAYERVALAVKSPVVMGDFNA